MNMGLIALRSLAASATLMALGVSACAVDNSPVTNVPGYLRIVNSTFQADPTNTQFTPIAVDVLIDSSTNSPGVANLPPNAIADGTTGPGGHNAKFFAFTPGVTSFVARKSGLTPAGPTFFTSADVSDPNCTPRQYLPRQQLTGSTYYTLIVAGINPAPTSSGDSVINTLAGANVCGSFGNFSLASLTTVEEPFSPPATSASGTSTLQMGLHFWNAAPFTSVSNGSGDAIALFLTDGTPSTGPTAGDLGSLTPLRTAYYMSPSTYVYATAKPYWLTLVDNSGYGNIIYQVKINYQSGEVHTLIVQNTLPPGQTSFPVTPGTDPQTTFKVTDILDATY